jgi:leucyl aminopeptidase
MYTILKQNIHIDCGAGPLRETPRLSFEYLEEGMANHGEYLHLSKQFCDDYETIVIGLGQQSQLSSQRVKACVAKGMKAIAYDKITTCGIHITHLVEEYGLSIVDALVEGIMLGLYAPVSYKQTQEEPAYQVFLCGIAPAMVQRVKQRTTYAKNLAESIILTRNLVNMPANYLTPTTFADIAKDIGQQEGFQVEVLEETEIETLGMSALLTVGSSGSKRTRLIIMRYTGDPLGKTTTALVGKGITCDTGGYCLKPSQSMLGIKGDMAGGATVLGVMRVLAKNQVKSNVIGVIPTCENRLSRESYVPGDVIGSMSGKTIEIINTDAEGRLILADSLTYVQKKEKVDRVIDIATLTGSIVSALGFSTAGILSNDKGFAQDFLEAGKTGGEQYLQLPIYDEYRKLLESDIADIKNVGASYLGTITAGIFLENFIQDIPWIHVDIAGTAWVDSPVFEYQAKGATGSSVTTLYHLFDSRNV